MTDILMHKGGGKRPRLFDCIYMLGRQLVCQIIDIIRVSTLLTGA